MNLFPIGLFFFFKLNLTPFIFRSLKIQRFNLSSIWGPRSPAFSFLKSIRVINSFPKQSLRKTTAGTLIGRLFENMESEANVAQLPRIRSVPEFRGRSWLQWQITPFGRSAYINHRTFFFSRCPTSKHELHVAEQQMLRCMY